MSRSGIARPVVLLVGLGVAGGMEAMTEALGRHRRD